MNIEVEATQDETKSITQLWHQMRLANSYAPKEKPDFVHASVSTYKITLRTVK